MVREVQMKKVNQLIFIVIIFVVSTIFITNQLMNMNDGDDTDSRKPPQLKSKQTDKHLVNFMNGDIYSWMNESKEELIKEFGEPIRKDLSAYHYTWFIYHLDDEQYIQFGIENDRIVTIYTTSDYVSIDPLEIGQPFDQLDERFSLKNEVTYHEGLSFYTFILSEDDIKSQPLLKLSEDIFVQIYFDTMTKELSSLRLLTGDVLLRQRFYEMKYRGNIPDMLSDLDDEWNEIEKGLQLQIFDLTNVIRNHHDINDLIWNKEVSKVAYKHSEDMSENNYFSHYRQDGSGLKERLAEKDIYYLSAGENIAAQHSDAPAAVHGWLNSESHREALLNDEFNYLGVGVYRLYYTQNFIHK